MYKFRYHDLQIKVEREIMNMKKKHPNKVMFDQWFQMYYPPMQAKLEDAYTEWLVYGQKDMVELHKMHLDIGTHVEDLRKARISLRSSMKISLDRTAVIYPVTFEPGNWYEYLRTR